MAEAPVSDPMILDGVLLLSGERHAAIDTTETERALGLFRLCAAAYLGGVRHVLVHDAKDQQTVKASAESFNKLLASRGLQRMAVRVAKPGGAAERRARAAWQERDAVTHWRGGLRLNAERPDAPLERLQAIAADGPDALFAAAPVISPDICSGCDACLRVCPNDVLTQIKDTESLGHYNTAPDSCDGCGLCVEMCSPGAIKVQTMVNAPKDIPLAHWLCPDCGVPTRAPVQQGRQGGACPICAATGHHKKLFQVLS